MDIFGEALLDYYQGNYTEDLKTYSSLDELDIMPLPYLFRDFEQMPILEQKALELVSGRVLDIGCGSGSHALHLQENGHEIVGLDSSKGAVEVCQRRGLQQVVHSELLTFSSGKYDTLLLMMNGIGIVGKLKLLPQYLAHFERLLNPNGQILLDSSDIIYMFQEDDDGGYWVPGNNDYYGEVSFQFMYKNKKGPIFDWLYIDFNTLETLAKNEKWNCELICQGDHYDYLARLTLK